MPGRRQRRWCGAELPLNVAQHEKPWRGSRADPRPDLRPHVRPHVWTKPQVPLGGGLGGAAGLGDPPHVALEDVELQPGLDWTLHMAANEVAPEGRPHQRDTSSRPASQLCKSILIRLLALVAVHCRSSASCRSLLQRKGNRNQRPYWVPEECLRP